MARRLLTSSGSSGGGASSDLPAVLTDTPVLVASNGAYIRSSSYNQQSSTSYQAFHALSNDGTFGGLFDPYNSSNNGGPTPCGFYVNPATGALGSLQTGSTIYNSGNGGHFSTCQHGSVGMMVLNNGHHQNPTYGTTHKGWLYGAGFNNDGTVNATGNSQGPHEYWPHSNGDLAISATSATGTAYARRSGYNLNTGTYFHNRFYFAWDGTSTGSQNEWNNPSSTTSTNYCTSAQKQSKDDLEQNGMIFWYDSSGNKRLAALYGDCDRNNDYDANSYVGFNDNVIGYHLSNGEYLWYYNGKVAKSNSSGVMSNLSTMPANIGFLGLINNRDSQMRMTMPCQEDDTWITTTDGYGLMKFKIHVNDNYRVEVTGIYNTLAWLFSQNVSESGKTLGLVGPNDEYLVYCSVQNGYADRYVYENPFAS